MHKYIKSNSGKDIRDILYTNNTLSFNFEDDDDYNAFIDFVTREISFFGFFTIEDVLAYFSIPHDFILSREYGWGLDDLDYNATIIESPYIKGELIYTLPIPKHINEIEIPKFLG